MKKKESRDKKLVVNGLFLTENITGIQRFGYELLSNLSKHERTEIIVAVPQNVQYNRLENIDVTYVEVGKFKSRLWEQWSLPRYCKRNHYKLLNIGNIAPISYPSNLVIHDVIYNEKDSSAFSKKWVKKMRAMTRAVIYKCEHVYTVSNFSKERILNFYPKLKKQPIVTCNGWEHIMRIVPQTVDDLPDKFYCAVGSVHPNKNFKYVIALAKNNPDKTFVICGKKNPQYSELYDTQLPDNCIFAGRVTDEQLVWLYSKCKGFILPSLYEGFGIPPLEAIAAGCKKIFLSDIPVFREIYGNIANYFDPLDYEKTVNLEEGKNINEAEKDALLEKYSWKNAAEIIINSMFPKEERA